MLRLYEQYRGSRDPPTPPGPWLRRGNTVRGFRPLPAGERAPRPREEGDPVGAGLGHGAQPRISAGAGPGPCSLSRGVRASLG